MIKTYTLKGLDCANCAAKIEASVRALEGVSFAAVNFLTATLQVDVSADHTGLHGLIERAVHMHEPDIAVIAHGAGGKADVRDEEERPRTARLLCGVLASGAGVLLSRFTGENAYASLALYVAGYLLLGGDVLLRALASIARGRVFDENFLMCVATAGAFAIGEYPEAVAVMLFFQIGEYVQGLAVRRSKKSIAGLMDIRPDFANLKKDGETVRVAPETVGVGDVIVVRPGEKIPLDGVILEGEAMLDTMALTGESVPRRASVSDVALSGCINQNGVLTMEVTKPFGESTAAKILQLVENAAGKKAPTEAFITKFSRYYTPVVVGLAALIALLPPLLLGGIWAEWVNRGLVFLVISCPCALVVSIPLGFFGGIGGASRRGVLVKGGNYLEALNSLDTVVFDKTGTLTKGVFTVTAVEPAAGFTESELLAHAAQAEAFSSHPIALSIRKAYGGDVAEEILEEYEECSGQGVSVLADGKRVLAGNHKLMERADVPFAASRRAGTKVYVAVDGVFAGCVVISDELRPDSSRAVAALRARGVRRLAMLTGDDPAIAQDVAGELKLDEAWGGLLPHQKVEKVEALCAAKPPKGRLAFVGDGINDAPVLARADVGVAMGDLGSDAAIEAADVVLMTDEPMKLAEAMDVARFTRRVVWQNIVFALGVKGIFLLLGAFGSATMWEAVFADVGVALLAILNATRVMRR